MINQNFELLQSFRTLFDERITKDQLLDLEKRKDFEQYKKWKEMYDNNSVRDNPIRDWETLVSLADDYNNIDIKSRYEVLRLVYEMCKDEEFSDFYNMMSTKTSKENFPALVKRFNSKKERIKLHDEKWHEFVGLTKDFPTFKKMRDSIHRCVQSNELLRSHVFTFDFIKGVKSKLPDRYARIIELEKLFESFVHIQKRITNEISFENSYSRSKLPYPKGIVLWNETFLHMKNSSSMEIISLLPERKFNTPENVFLSLCMIAISKKIAEIDLSHPNQPFAPHEQSILSEISLKIEELIRHFPFQDSLVDAQNENKKLGSSIALKKFADKTNLRLSNHLIKNKQYSNLLLWYQDFIDETRLIDDFKTGIGDYLLESTKSRDKAFEYFIFFNLLDYLSKSTHVYNIIWKSEGKDDENKYSFDFDYNKKHYRFHMSYYLQEENTTMKLGYLTPDFAITEIDSEKLIWIADAKNAYGKSATEFKHLIENYMGQSDTKYGMIIWPQDDVEKGKKRIVMPNMLTKHGELYKWDVLPLPPTKTDLSKYCEMICRRIYAACSNLNCRITDETKLVSV